MSRSATPASGDEETRREKTTRKWNEMLQELRVAQTGVQVLTGFLLTVPFSTRFDELGTTPRVAYLATLTASIISAGLLIAPVAFHRVLFGRSEKEWLISAANTSSRAGLTMLALTMTGVMFLVFDLVLELWSAVAASAGTLLVLTGLWLVVPLLAREDELVERVKRHRP